MTKHEGNAQPPGHLAEDNDETRIVSPRPTDHHRLSTLYNKQDIEPQTFSTDTAEDTERSSKVHVIDNEPPSVSQSTDQNSAPTRLTGNSGHSQSSTLQKDSVDVGTILKDRFVLEDIIARGGMGVVYKARDLRKEEYKDRDPYVAVKVLGEECKTHPDFFMALQRETRKSQKLAHPNIVTVYDFDCDGDTVFMTMEYLVGQTLDVVIRENQPHGFDNKTAFSIIEGMGQGLAYAHKNGIVHCDFKPGNVFLTKDGTVKILDFGISRVAKPPDKRSQDTTVFDAGKFGALTPPYASCEMLEGDDPDPRDDIYALACVTYELLTGSHPFAREKATVARNRHMKPARIKGLNKHQWQALLHGLAFKRTIRTPSVDRFLRDIDGGYQFLGLTHGWQVIASLALIFVVSGAFLLPYMTATDANHGDDTITAYQSNGNRNTIDPTHLSPEQQDKISRLLEVAEVHLMVGRITEPAGSNAYDAYKQVLEINPNNPQAKAGLVKIADHYEKLARESLENGDVKKARTLIMAGLAVLPRHPGLTALNEETNPDAGWFKKIIGSVSDLF